MRVSERIVLRIKLLPSDLLIIVRNVFYRLLSSCKSVEGRPRLIQATLLSGRGRIRFGSNVVLGVRESPGTYSTYSYIEARNPDSEINISDDVWINNNLSLISEHDGIYIGRGCRIGQNFSCFDSNFHEIPLGSLVPIKRGKVVVHENVFIGANVTILHSVTVGKHAVIGAGSVISDDVPPYSIVAGNPSVVIKQFHA